MNETSDEDVNILSKTERSPRKKKKRKSRRKITDTSDDDDCTGNDFSQPLFTNEKTNCSPSKPNRRSLKNIFKNSSNFKKLSNDLAHDGSDDENKGQSLTNQQKSPKLSDYEKMLQPRSRLGYMTLKEAMNEKHSRSDQPFLVNNDSCGSSSSLPEISDHVTENNRPRKNRSKSAEMQRGSRHPTEQSIPSPEPYITSTVSKSKHPTTSHSPEQVERGRRMEKTNRVDHSRSREVIDSKHHKDSFSAFMELSNTSPKIGSMTLTRKYSPKHQSENTSFKPCDEIKNELENVKCDKLHTDYVLNIKDKSSTMPNCLGTKPTSLDVVNPTSQMENVSKVNANTNKEKEDISRGGRIEKRLDRRSYKSPRRFCGRSVSRERRKYGLTPNGSEKPDAIVSNNADGISHENHDKPDAIVSNKTAKISPKDREKSYDIVSNKVNLSKDDSKTERQKYSRSPNFFEKSETVLNKADISTAVCSTKSEIETKDTQTEPHEQHVSTHLSRSIQTSMNLLDIKSIDEEATGSAIKKTPKVPEIIEPSNTISEKETSIHEAQNDQIEKGSVSSSTSSSEEFKTPQQSPLPVRRSVELLNTDAPLGDRSEAKGGSEKKKPKISFLAVAALKRKLARQRNTKKSKMAEVEKKKCKHDQTVSGETNNDKTKCEKKGEISEKADKNKTKFDKKGETSEKSDNKTKCDKKGETSEKSDKKNKTLIYYENETGFNIGDLSFLPETDIIDAEELKKDITIADKKLSFDIVEPIGRDDSIETVYAHRTLAKRRQSEVFREKRKKALSLCKKFVAFLFSHIGLCSLMVAYAILGGFIFKALEGPFEKETKQKVYQCRETTKNSILTYATEMILEKWSRNETAEKIDQLLGVFQTAVYLATEKDGFNNAPGDNLDVEEQWSFASSLLFAITVMTTIGYGHVAPKTDYGRIVTIGYAVFGIPLTLLCLTNIGDLMATGFRMLYAKVCCGLCCILFTPKRRRMPDPEKGQGSGSIEYQEGKETVRTTEVINVPTSVCILLMTSYILLGTLLFSIWEKWDAITGTYFSFITLSTIGFGDVVPGTAMNQWENEEKLVLCAMYLVFGLSLIAMCFNLVQEDVKNKCRWLGAKIGIIDRRQ